MRNIVRKIEERDINLQVHLLSKMNRHQQLNVFAKCGGIIVKNMLNDFVWDEYVFALRWRPNSEPSVPLGLFEKPRQSCKTPHGVPQAASYSLICGKMPLNELKIIFSTKFKIPLCLIIFKMIYVWRIYRNYSLNSALRISNVFWSLIPVFECVRSCLE